MELSYSGGKDSDVILELAKMSGIPFRPIYKKTTIDPPCKTVFIKCDMELWFEYLNLWAESLGIDLERHIMMKMEYNKHRAALHGKKY